MDLDDITYGKIVLAYMLSLFATLVLGIVLYPLTELIGGYQRFAIILTIGTAGGALCPACVAVFFHKKIHSPVCESGIAQTGFKIRGC